jgi:hypothetical protein
VGRLKTIKQSRLDEFTYEKNQVLLGDLDGRRRRARQGGVASVEVAAGPRNRHFRRLRRGEGAGYLIQWLFKLRQQIRLDIILELLIFT